MSRESNERLSKMIIALDACGYNIQGMSTESGGIITVRMRARSEQTKEDDEPPNKGDE